MGVSGTVHDYKPSLWRSLISRVVQYSQQCACESGCGTVLTAVRVWEWVWYSTYSTARVRVGVVQYLQQCPRDSGCGTVLTAVRAWEWVWYSTNSSARENGCGTILTAVRVRVGVVQYLQQCPRESGYGTRCSAPFRVALSSVWSLLCWLAVLYYLGPLSCL